MPSSTFSAPDPARPWGGGPSSLPAGMVEGCRRMIEACQELLLSLMRIVFTSGRAVALAIGILATGAAASPAKTLAPITPWNVEWSTTACKLSRTFGNENDPSTLVFERFGSTVEFGLVAVDSGLRNFRKGMKIDVRFGDGSGFTVVNAVPTPTQDGKSALHVPAVSLAGTSSRKGRALTYPGTSPGEVDRIASVGMTVAGEEIIFKTGSLTKPLGALRQCTDDLVKSWGLDPEQQARRTRLPQPDNNPADWVTYADYPAALKKPGGEAIIWFRLMLDAQGRPTSCRVTQAIGEGALGDLTCALLMRRSMFEPALDATGQAIPTYYVNTVRWVLPRP